MKSPETTAISNGDVSKQYPIIDILKFIFAILIVTIHLPPLSSFYDNGKIFMYLNYAIKNYLARIGVPFFFAAAGFFLFRKIDPKNFEISVTKNYLFKLLRLLGVWTVLLIVGWTKHLWFMTGLIVAVLLLTFLLYKKVSLRKMIIIAAVLYLIGLLGESYFGIFVPLLKYAVVRYPIKTYFVIFSTTRNGVFMGFPFLLLGGIIQKGIIRVKKPFFAALGFFISMALMLCESVLVRLLNLPRDINMYLFLVPVVFFLLSFAVTVTVKPRPIYKKLRNTSIIIYFSHLLIIQFITFGFKFIKKFFGIQINNSLLYYILTVVISIALGLIIDRLSKNEKLSFLKYLYS